MRLLLSKLLINGRLIRCFSHSAYLRSTGSGYLRDSYTCDGVWAKRLQSPILQKVTIDDLFFEIDKKYQAENVLSAIDVDVFVNKVEDAEPLDEVEELAYRLRKSPATSDTLPSTGHAVIRAFLNAGRTGDLMRILNDRMNYGIFVDFYSANVLINEFIKGGNTRDAAKIASLLMLEEDFGPLTTKLMALVACLKYLKSPNPESWNPIADEGLPEDTEVKKERVNFLRNPYFDNHFDLSEPNHIIGKTLRLLGGQLDAAEKSLNLSVELLGSALEGKWEHVDRIVQQSISSSVALADEAIKKVSELLEKAVREIEASPTKTLSRPQLPQFPAVNLDPADVAAFWNKVPTPNYAKILPKIKANLTSGKLTIANDLDLISRAEKLLSAALAEREDEEIQQQIKTYEEWDKLRADELQNQIRRFKANQIIEDIEAKKKDLKEKEEVIFFFDHEEEWMMKLPPAEQKGYKLSEDYRPTNLDKFVKTIPPKKNRKKKKKV